MSLRRKNKTLQKIPVLQRGHLEIIHREHDFRSRNLTVKTCFTCRRVRTYTLPIFNLLESQSFSWFTFWRDSEVSHDELVPLVNNTRVFTEISQMTVGDCVSEKDCNPLHCSMTHVKLMYNTMKNTRDTVLANYLYKALAVVQLQLVKNPGGVKNPEGVTIAQCELNTINNIVAALPRGPHKPARTIPQLAHSEQVQELETARRARWTSRETVDRTAHRAVDRAAHRAVDWAAHGAVGQTVGQKQVKQVKQVETETKTTQDQASVVMADVMPDIIIVPITTENIDMPIECTPDLVDEEQIPEETIQSIVPEKSEQNNTVVQQNEGADVANAVVEQGVEVTRKPESVVSQQGRVLLKPGTSKDHQLTNKYANIALSIHQMSNHG